MWRSEQNDVNQTEVGESGASAECLLSKLSEEDEEEGRDSPFMKDIHNHKKSTRTCIKVANLRKLYDQDYTLEKWLESESGDNVYCGRSGRIFINGKYFAYEGSKWANPYTVKKYSLDECIALYREYITKKIEEDPGHYDLDELKGKNLGCWCNPKDKCHVDVLLSLLD